MFRILLALPVLLLAAACSSGDSDGDGKLAVVATTTQIGDFARQVGGDSINLTVILRPNQDAHDFDPQPSQIRAIADADVVLQNGIGLDAFVSRATEQSSGSVITVTTGITLREGGHDHDEDEDEHEDEDEEDHADEEHEDEEHEGDPHVWLSVSNAITMVENIRDALIEADSANAADYRANADRYLAELRALDSEISAEIASIPAACRKLVTNHDVLGYYAEAYGLQFIGSIVPGTSTEARASASDVANIVEQIRAERVPAIFAEASINPALVNQVAREAGVSVVDDLYGDSLGEASSDGGTYIGMMRSNTEKIAGALKGCTA